MKTKSTRWDATLLATEAAKERSSNETFCLMNLVLPVSKCRDRGTYSSSEESRALVMLSVVGEFRLVLNSMIMGQTGVKRSKMSQ